MATNGSLFEELISSDLVVHEFLRVLVVSNALRRQKGQKEVSLCPGNAPESSLFTPETLCVVGINHKGPFGELDLEEDYTVVGAVYQQIDLSPFRPGVVLALNLAMRRDLEAANLQDALDLIHMSESERL